MNNDFRWFNCHPQTELWCKVNFSQAFVCPQGGLCSRVASVWGGLCPGGLCPGGSVQGVSTGGLCLGGLFLGGSLSRGSLSRGGLCPGGLYRGSLSRGSLQGVSVQGGLSRGSLSREGLCPGVLSREGLYPGRSLSRGSLSREGLCPGRVSVQGVSVQEFCPGRVSVQGGLCPGRSLSRGVSVQRGISVWGSLTRGISVRGVSVHEVVSVQSPSLSWRPLLTVEEQAVRILLERILVLVFIHKSVSSSSDFHISFHYIFADSALSYLTAWIWILNGYQWRIQDFQEGPPTLEGKLLPKTAWKKKEFGLRGGASLAHPLGYATGYFPSFSKF